MNHVLIMFAIKAIVQTKFNLDNFVSEKKYKLVSDK